jgi:hypothetical protein
MLHLERLRSSLSFAIMLHFSLIKQRRSMNAEQFQGKIFEITGLNGGPNCITCNTDNLNWVTDLQDLLEEEKIPVDVFCKTGGSGKGEIFEIKNNRLRIMKDQRCISPVNLINIFNNMKL